MKLLAPPKKLPPNQLIHQPNSTKIRSKMDFALSPIQFITAIFLILLCGIIFAGAMYYKMNPNLFVKTISHYSPVTKEPLSFSLNVNSPEDNTLSYEKNVLISGRTSANSTIIVTRLDQTFGFSSDEKGEFSKIIPLEKGPNPLTINSFDSSGNVKTVTRNVYFTDDKLDEDK